MQSFSSRINQDIQQFFPDVSHLPKNSFAKGALLVLGIVGFASMFLQPSKAQDGLSVDTSLSNAVMSVGKLQVNNNGTNVVVLDSQGIQLPTSSQNTLLKLNTNKYIYTAQLVSGDIGAGMITTEKIADGAITCPKLTTGGGIFGVDLQSLLCGGPVKPNLSCAAGQYLIGITTGAQAICTGSTVPNLPTCAEGQTIMWDATEGKWVCKTQLPVTGESLWKIVENDLGEKTNDIFNRNTSGKVAIGTNSSNDLTTTLTVSGSLLVKGNGTPGSAGSTTNAVCGPANGTTATAPIGLASQLCSVGVPMINNLGGGTENWACVTPNGSVTCSATIINTAAGNGSATTSTAGDVGSECYSDSSCKTGLYCYGAQDTKYKIQVLQVSTPAGFTTNGDYLYKDGQTQGSIATEGYAFPTSDLSVENINFSTPTLVNYSSCESFFGAFASVGGCTVGSWSPQQICFVNTYSNGYFSNAKAITCSTSNQIWSPAQPGTCQIKPSQGVCGPSNGQTYIYGNYNGGDSFFCSGGAITEKSITSAGATWKCSGSLGTASCSFTHTTVTAATPFTLATPDTGSILYVTGGKVGILTSNPLYPLDVVGTIRAAAYLQNSDARLKTNITPLQDALKNILGINGYTYNLKSDGSFHYGVIAQEIEKFFPYLVSTDENGMKSVNYNGLIAPIIESIKTLNTKVNSLQTQLDSNTTRIEALEKLQK